MEFRIRKDLIQKQGVEEVDGNGGFHRPILYIISSELQRNLEVDAHAIIILKCFNAYLIVSHFKIESIRETT